MISSRVVLPAPLGPTTAIRRPAVTCRLRSSKRCCAPWLLATPARVTRLTGSELLGRGSHAGQTRAVGIEAQSGGHPGHARAVPRLLHGMRADRGVADGQHAWPGARQAGPGRTALVG